MTEQTDQVVQRDTKSIFASKTLWLNLITIVVSVISITDPGVIGVKAETLLWVNGVLNILLRFLTHGSVALNPLAPDTTKKG